MNPIMYDTIPIIKGIYLSERFEMSLSVPMRFAHKRMIAKGRAEVNINDISSRTANFDMLNVPFSNDKTVHIIRNSGMHIIGGFVTADIALATFCLFI